MGDIITPKRLQKLREKIESLRQRSGSIRPEELSRIAVAVGRKLAVRGKEPTYASPRPGWFPLSIPNHPGTLKRGTACNIPDQLERDLELLESAVRREDNDGA